MISMYQQVRRALREGPATLSDLQLAFPVRKRRQVMMSLMNLVHEQKHARKVAQTTIITKNRWGDRPYLVWIYELTPRGEAITKRRDSERKH